jgi:biotin carboxyl carrier protein
MESTVTVYLPYPEQGSGWVSVIGEIEKVHVSVGDTVKVGDLLLELDRGQDTLGLRSEYVGRVVGVRVDVGKDVHSGDPLFEIELEN